MYGLLPFLDLLVGLLLLRLAFFKGLCGKLGLKNNHLFKNIIICHVFPVVQKCRHRNHIITVTGLVSRVNKNVLGIL